MKSLSLDRNGGTLSTQEDNDPIDLMGSEDDNEKKNPPSSMGLEGDEEEGEEAEMAGYDEEEDPSEMMGAEDDYEEEEDEGEEGSEGRRGTGLRVVQGLRARRRASRYWPHCTPRAAAGAPARHCGSSSETA